MIFRIPFLHDPVLRDSLYSHLPLITNILRLINQGLCSLLPRLPTQFLIKAHLIWFDFRSWAFKRSSFVYNLGGVRHLVVLTPWGLPQASLLTIGSTVELVWDSAGVEICIRSNEWDHLVGVFFKILVLALWWPFWANTDTSPLVTWAMALVHYNLWRLQSLLVCVSLSIRLHQLLASTPSIKLSIKFLPFLEAIVLGLLYRKRKMLREQIIIFEF